jgi:hypothetical protein
MTPYDLTGTALLRFCSSAKAAVVLEFNQSVAHVPAGIAEDICLEQSSESNHQTQLTPQPFIIVSYSSRQSDRDHALHGYYYLDCEVAACIHTELRERVSTTSKT